MDGREGPVLVSFLDNPLENLEGKPRNKLSYTSIFFSFISHVSLNFSVFTFNFEPGKLRFSACIVICLSTAHLSDEDNFVDM